MIQVITHYCPQNHPCPVVSMCPVGAISQHGFNAPQVDNDECIECGICTSGCTAFVSLEDKISVS